MKTVTIDLFRFVLVYSFTPLKISIETQSPVLNVDCSLIHVGHEDNFAS